MFNTFITYLRIFLSNIWNFMNNTTLFSIDYYSTPDLSGNPVLSTLNFSIADIWIGALVFVIIVSALARYSRG